MAGQKPAGQPRPAVALGPVEQLLATTRKIHDTEREVRNSRLVVALFGLSALLGPVALLALAIVTIATFGRVDMARVICSLLPVIAAATAAMVACYLYMGASGWKSAGELGLELSLLREQRRLRSAELTLEARYARSSYKDDVARDVDHLRRESRRYRRVHNWFQSVIIVGALAITTISGIALERGPLQWLAVCTSFSIGLAAGFTGYFKFRERSFYLRQTADAIEQEWTAAELSIFRYKHLTEDEQLAILVEEVERLKATQGTREQSLDQPAEHRRHHGAG